MTATVEEVLDLVANGMGVKRSDITGPYRHKNLVIARHVASLALRDAKNLSFPEIGRALGNRDHTTVMSSVRKARLLVEKQPSLAEIVMAAEDLCKQQTSELLTQDRLVRLFARRETVVAEIHRLQARLSEIDRAIASERAALNESGLGEAEGIAATG